MATFVETIASAALSPLISQLTYSAAATVSKAKRIIVKEATTTAAIFVMRRPRAGCATAEEITNKGTLGLQTQGLAK